MFRRVSDREILEWAEVGPATRALAEAVHADGWEPDVILAIARGGLLVAGALGYALGVKNTCTMNVEFYTGVDERLDLPMILPPVPDLVDLEHARVLIADDVADTGLTLQTVQDFCGGGWARCAPPCSTRSRARSSGATTSGAARTAGSCSPGAPSRPSARPQAPRPNGPIRTWLHGPPPAGAVSGASRTTRAATNASASSASARRSQGERRTSERRAIGMGGTIGRRGCAAATPRQQPL